MKIEITTEKDNPLRKRKMYWLSAEHPGKETPSRYEILPEVVKKLGAKEDLIVINKIFSERGIAKSAIKVFVYKDKSDILPAMVERQERKVKAFLEKKEKKKEEPAAAPPEEKAPEEGKEGEKPEGEPAEEVASEGEEAAKEGPAAEESGTPEGEAGAEEPGEKPEEAGEEEEPKEQEKPKEEE